MNEPPNCFNPLAILSSDIMQDDLLVSIIATVISTVFLFFLSRLINRGKGKVGEKVVSVKLGRLPKDRYIVMDDLTIPTANGSTQIDHLIVSVYGIFVIETKNYKGWIYGDEYGEYWTQNIYGNKNELYNPVLQNAGHVRAVRRVLKEFEPLTIIPIVAFSDSADLRVRVNEACVVYWSEILRVINSFDNRQLTWDRVNEIKDKLTEVQLEPGRKTNRQHLKNIQKAREHKFDALASGRCPRCGGKLVERSGRYGKFYGCSNYPKCKYTHP